jgi:hypothetical protein
VQAMLDEGYTPDGAAQALGWSAQRVTARAKILRLSDAGQRLVGTGALALSAIDDLLRVGDVSVPVMEAIVTAIGRQVIDGGDFARNPAWAIGRSLNTANAPFAAQLTTLRAIDSLRLGKTYTALMAEAEKLHRYPWLCSRIRARAISRETPRSVAASSTAYLSASSGCHGEAQPGSC